MNNRGVEHVGCDEDVLCQTADAEAEHSSVRDITL